jgi:CBS domain-containing protein
MRFYHHHWLPGTAPNWQNHHLPGTASFVVELPAGSLSSRRLRRHVHAVLGRLRAHPVVGSVVHADAALPCRRDDRRMAYAEHRPDEFPVAFETGTVGDAMSRGLISCSPETPLRVVARMMATYGVHAIFVFEYAENGDRPQLWAVVSDLDLVAATRLDLDTLTAGATAVTPLVSVAADSPIGEAGSLMAQHGIAHLAVTEPSSHSPIGVISTLDIARAIAAGHGRREVFASA